MSDLISRKDAIKHIKAYRDEFKEDFGIDGEDEDDASHYFGYIAGMNRAARIIEGLPSAEPKKGKWTIETIGEIPRYRDSSIYEPIYRCSCCGLTSESYIRFEEPYMPEDADFPNFCPNCGAEMEVTE